MTRQPMNFDRVIRMSGLSKKEIAAQKKIKPETLSRHLSGAIRMTLDDAYEYAEILGCTPQEIFYVQDPIPVLIKNYTRNNDDDPIFKSEFERVLDTNDPDILYAPSYFQDKLAACVTVQDSDYQGKLTALSNSVDVVLADPILKGYVCRRSHQQMSYVSIKNIEDVNMVREKTNVVLMEVFPQPNNRYSLYNPLTSVQFDNLELNWATPLCAMVPQPSVFIPNWVPYS